MENDNVLEKEQLLADCTENGWKLFIHEVAKLKGSEGKKTKREILRPVPITQRLSNLQSQLESVAEVQWREDPRLQSLTEAKVAVMTTNKMIFRVMSNNEEGELPQGYIKTMLALNASLPWNKTGFNTITINQLRINDLKESSDFIKSKLSR